MYVRIIFIMIIFLLSTPRNYENSILNFNSERLRTTCIEKIKIWYDKLITFS